MNVLVDKMTKSRDLLLNTGWLLSTEILAKVSRIVTILALAAMLTPVEYGIALLSVACHEVLRMLLRSGTGSQVIQCSERDISNYVQNAVVIQWLMGVLLFILQVGAAYVIGSFYDNEDVTKLVTIMAIVYLIYPIVSIKVFLLHRSENIRHFSLRNAASIIIENISLASFALIGFGIYSVALSKLCLAITWVALFYNAPVKRYGVGFDLYTFVILCKSSFQLMGSELLRSLRLHADIFIAGRLLSPEIFGLYSFAKTAGVGISQSISYAFNTALYPHLCKRHNNMTLHNGIFWVYSIACGVSLLFVVQAALVPVYMPIIFDEKWIAATSTTAILCLAMISTIYIDVYSSIARATGRLKQELRMRTYALILLCSAPILLQPKAAEDYAFAILFGSLCSILLIVGHSVYINANTLLNTVVKPTFPNKQQY